MNLHNLLKTAVLKADVQSKYNYPNFKHDIIIFKTFCCVKIGIDGHLPPPSQPPSKTELGTVSTCNTIFSNNALPEYNPGCWKSTSYQLAMFIVVLGITSRPCTSRLLPLQPVQLTLTSSGASSVKTFKIICIFMTYLKNYICLVIYLCSLNWSLSLVKYKDCVVLNYDCNFDFIYFLQSLISKLGRKQNVTRLIIQGRFGPLYWAFMKISEPG